jgi:serine/threonine-protein kinase
VDPVVRVEARRLRDRLKSWYEGEGRDARIRIELPRGGYAAVFHDQALLTGAPSKPKSTPAQRTIAVLPFANLNSGAETDYLCDGLTEELIHSLTKVRELRVVAWNSALRMKGREKDLEAIREQLGVETILRGSVRCSGDHLRITAQLIDAANGYYLWSEAWDRAAADVFDIEEEIAQAIVNTLRVRLWPESQRRLTPKATSIACYNLYLKGRFHWNKRSPEGLRLGLRCFEDAVALDPDWALGWAGLGDSFAVLAENGLLPQETAIPAANRAVERATSLDPNLAEAYATLGLLRSRYDWKWDEAAVFFRRAIDLNPGYATAHFWYGFHYLAMTGPSRGGTGRGRTCCLARSTVGHRPGGPWLRFDGVAPLRGGNRTIPVAVGVRAVLLQSVDVTRASVCANGRLRQGHRDVRKGSATRRHDS